MKIFKPQAIPPAFSQLTRSTTGFGVRNGQLINVSANVLRYDEGMPLVEPSSTNLLLQSQALDVAPWGGDCSAGLTAFWAGSVPLFGVSKTTVATNEHRSQYVNHAVSAGQTLTFSIVLQGYPTTSVSGVGISDAAYLWGDNADSTAQIISGPGALAQHAGALWHVSGLIPGQSTLVRVTRRFASASAAVLVYVFPGTYASTTIGDSVIAGRPQLEPGDQATSYIPTTTATVTRAADVLTPSTNLSGGTGTAGGYLLINAPNSADTAWTPITYTDGIRVAWNGMLWVLAAGQTAAGTDVPGVSAKWLRVGPDNRTAWFDGEVNSRSSSLIAAVNRPIGFLVSLESACDTVLVSDIDQAQRLRVSISSDLYSPPFFDQTVSIAPGQQSLRSQYMFTGFQAPAGSVLRVGLAGGALPVAVGMVAWGKTEELGCTEWGTRAGIKDYSRKEPDDFGQVVFVRRAFSKTISGTVEVLKPDINTVYDRLASLRATPVVWIFSDDPDHAVPLVVYGFYKDFYATFPGLNSTQFALEIEGLT